MLSRDDDIHDVGPDIHTCPDRDRRCVDSCVEMKLSNRAYNQDYNFYNIGIHGKRLFAILSFVNICTTWIIYANWSLCFGKCYKLVCLQSLYH